MNFMGRNALTGVLRFKNEAFWVFVGQLGTALGVLFGVKVLTQVMGPFEFGRLMLANTVVLLIGTNLFGPLGQGFMRFWSISYGRGQGQEFAAATNHYAKLLTWGVLGLSFVWLMVATIMGWFEWSLLIWLSLVVGSFTGLFGLRLSVFLAARKRRMVALANTGIAFLKPLVAVLFVMVLSSDADRVMGAYLLVILSAFLVLEHFYEDMMKAAPMHRSTTSNSGREFGKLGREIIEFSLPFWVWGVFGWIHQSCDRWSLQIFHGPDVVGSFSVISILASYPLIFGANFLSNLFLPVAYERAGTLTSTPSIRSANNILYLMVGTYVVGACILIGVFLLFHKKVVSLMSSMGYVEYSYLLPGLSIAWGFFYLGQMFSGFGLLANKPKKCIFPVVVSAVIAATMTTYLSKHYGPLGVVWGLGISGFVYAVWFMAIGFRLSSSVRLDVEFEVTDKDKNSVHEL
jgi:O-antigen/teichoic acid export membrane protein